GNFWNQVMELDVPGTFNVANGCSLQFKTRYAIECNYDYAYVEFFSTRHSKWVTVDVFNGKSGCTALRLTKACRHDWNDYSAHTLCNSGGSPIPYGSAVNYPGSVIASSPRDFPQYPYVNANQWVLIRGDSITTTPTSASVKLRWRFISDALYSSEEPG